ncbi:acyltransferase family protein [Paractinoplanes lichenicola]|uniref:Acyltransferase n=1 Tax=Paractinoplanes lichenicola TaxID=2802976 RepID=A0ABS1VM71_9ACTN|nr:acyltransferase [Actinoplanes lichenicola]MBL7255833.1 acyltransferase [Actinoplanes lichenicola]
MSRPRLAAIDGLRLIAALAVLAFHYTVAWRIDGVRLPEHFLPSTVHVTIYGLLGVELFFLISGFVICMSSWGRTLGQFFASRVSRLFPAYWAAVILTGVVAMIFPLTGGVTDGGRPSVLDLAINLTMLQQPLGHDPVDGVYWTLFVELKFYLIMAIVLARGGLTYRRAVLLCAVWMTAAVFAPSLGSPALNALVISDYAPYFIGGIALYLIHRFGPAPLLFGITGLAWLVCLARVNDRMHDLGPKVPPWPGFVIITLSYAVLLLVALGYTDRIQWRWLTVAGALTYPLYLLHSRIGHTVIRAAYERLTAPVWVMITVTTLLMLGLAWLVHRWVERPLGRRLRDLVLTPPADRSKTAPPVRTPSVPAQAAFADDQPERVVTKPILVRLNRP